MNLTISQTFARIGIDTTPARMEMQTHTSRLELQSKRSELNIHTELPKIEIDQHECFSSAGLKSVFELSREQAQSGMQQAMEFIGSTVAEGKQLAAIENGVNAIAEIARQSMYHEHEFNIVAMPSARPKIDVSGSISFNPDPVNNMEMRNGIRTSFIPGSVSMNYTPSKVRIYMSQYPSVNISYTGNKVDTFI